MLLQCISQNKTRTVRNCINQRKHFRKDSRNVPRLGLVKTGRACLCLLGTKNCKRNAGKLPMNSRAAKPLKNCKHRGANRRTANKEQLCRAGGPRHPAPPRQPPAKRRTAKPTKDNETAKNNFWVGARARQEPDAPPRNLKPQTKCRQDACELKSCEATEEPQHVFSYTTIQIIEY